MDLLFIFLCFLLSFCFLPMVVAFFFVVPDFVHVRAGGLERREQSVGLRIMAVRRFRVHGALCAVRAGRSQ